jgi:DNA-binding NarL/FixJ family response regulator
MLPTQTVRVLILHQDPLISAGISTALRKNADIEVLETEPDADAGTSPSWRVDVVVADYDTALEIVSNNRIEAVPRGTAPINVLIVTRCESERQIRHALERGVRGYLLLGCTHEELAEAVRILHRGSRHLSAVVAQRIAESLAFEMPTVRELDVLRLLARGHGNKAIALKLNIAVGTVKSHVKAILQKLDAATRTEAAAVADRRGLLTLGSGSNDQPAGSRNDWQPRVSHQATRVHADCLFSASHGRTGPTYQEMT